MEPTFIAVACGWAVYLIKLPPLIGFLAAGFVLNAMGYESNTTLDSIANLGVRPCCYLALVFSSI